MVDSDVEEGTDWFRDRRGWLWLFAAVVVVGIGKRIGLPGSGSFIVLGPVFEPLAVPALIGAGAGALLAAWAAGFLGWSRRMVLVGYTATSLIWAVWAGQLIVYSGMFGRMSYYGTIALLLIGNLVLLALADRLDRTKLGSGPLLVFALLAVPRLVQGAFFDGGRAAWGSPSLGSLAYPLALAGLVAVLAVTRRRWPLEWGSRALLRSPLDAFVLPVAVGEMVWFVLTMSTDYETPPGALEMLLKGSQPWLCALTAVAIAAVVWRSGSRRPSWAVVLSPLVLLVTLAAWVVGVWDSEMTVREVLFPPGPFEGSETFRAEVTCESLPDDAAAHLEQRLGAMSVDATVELDDEALLVHLYDVVDGPRIMQAGVASGRVHLWPVDDDAPRSRSGELVLGAEPIADPLGIERSDVTFDDYGQPYVRMKLDEASTEAFGRWTTANVGRRMAFYVGDELIIAPTVAEPITGGYASLTTGSDPDPLRAAYALAARMGTAAPGDGCTWEAL